MRIAARHLIVQSDLSRHAVGVGDYLKGSECEVIRKPPFLDSTPQRRLKPHGTNRVQRSAYTLLIHFLIAALSAARSGQVVMVLRASDGTELAHRRYMKLSNAATEEMPRSRNVSSCLAATESQNLAASVGAALLPQQTRHRRRSMRQLCASEH
jgi:hypothetical protein